MILKKLTDLEIQNIVNYYLSGKSIQACADYFSGSYSQIKKILIDNNIELRKREAWNKGLSALSDERVAKYSKSLLNKPKSAETKAKIGEANKGKHRSEQHIAALKEGAHKRKKSFSEEEINTVRDIYLSPNSIDTVSKITGLSRYYILNILSQLGIPLHDVDLKNKLMIEKAKKTKLEKYGDENFVNVEKRLLTLENKTADYWLSRSNKVKDTCIAKYGVDNVRKAPEIKNKIKLSKLEKYGDENYNNREKASETMLDLYGVHNYSQTKEFIDRPKFKLYRYEDVSFDSFPELCVYLYFMETGHDISRNSEKFEYFFDGIKHYCFVDFKIDNKLIEIKGDYLYQKMMIPNSLENEKLKCLLNHGVEIWTSEVYNFYINWFRESNHNINDYILQNK